MGNDDAWQPVDVVRLGRTGEVLVQVRPGEDTHGVIQTLREEFDFETVEYGIDTDDEGVTTYWLILKNVVERGEIHGEVA